MFCEFCPSDGGSCSVCGKLVVRVGAVGKTLAKFWHHELDKAATAAPRNARFWVYERGGWVKLTLRPGQSLQIYTGGPCDEGSHFESVTWGHEGNRVTCEYHTWGRDCDGRHEYHSFRACKLGQLKGMDHTDPESGERLALPMWERAEEGQRDYTAEAMGC